MADTKAVVVVQQKSNALTGSLDEKFKAFQQIAANLALLQLNGWDTAQKTMSACWMADGAGMHPAVFMQNHYCILQDGRLSIEPKWEFVVGVLQSRIPGFVFKILEEDDRHAKVFMSDGKGNDHTVEYTVEDAKRQGLMGRKNMWSAGNTREGCLKQAIKRCGKRIGAGALMDLPLDFATLEPETEPTPSPAAVVQAAVEKVTGKKPEKAEEVPFEEVTGEFPGEDYPQAPIPADPQAPSPNTTTVRQRLAAAIKRDYGLTAKADVAEKVNFLYNAMLEETVGVAPDPKITFKPGQVGPMEAQQIIDFLEKKKAERGAKGAPQPSADPSPSEDAPPLTEEAPEAAPQRNSIDAYEALMATVARARKSIKPARPFVQEGPPNSGTFWFVDGATAREAGETESLKIQVAGEIVAPIDRLDHLNKILAAMCDKAERNGR